MHRHKIYGGHAGKENMWVTIHTTLDAAIFHTAETMREKTKEKDKEKWEGAFPGGSVVKNLPSNARDEGLIPGGGTKIPQAIVGKSQLLSTGATSREKPMPHNERSHMLQLRPTIAKK